MFTYINMDRSLLKNGGRNAYQMSLEDFKTLLNEALRPISVDYDEDYYDGDDYHGVGKKTPAFRPGDELPLYDHHKLKCGNTALAGRIS